MGFYPNTDKIMILISAFKIFQTNVDEKSKSYSVSTPELIWVWGQANLS